ncbi:helix-turn-helix domain-containing protein [Sphingobacterium composti Ten et al. 2007 non Yoo et al. 2007]|uniref:helix-turn-helix domain-containing protein n=1 Tax=Sphingobacterium composti TaxID=363260 RepID=UPI00135C5B61|nr:helix-turn-helix transcriptional regulator [Sphingobacterium composti Ten et al. 2007 non Yoo et al. 2007]
MAKKFLDPEIQLINIYIGIVLRHARLTENLSRHDISLKCDIDSMAIGRIERAEHMSNWSSIYILCRYLNVEFSKLFVLKKEYEYINIIEKSYTLEKKLNIEKKRYYKMLTEKVKDLFREIKDNTNS